MIKIADILIDAGLVQGLFLAFLLLYKKKRHRANQILAGLLVVFAVGIVHARFAGGHLQQVFQAPLKVVEPFVMLIAPLLWMYVDKIVGQSKMSFWQTILHFIPFATFILLTLPFLVHRGSFTSEHILFKNTALITLLVWVGVLGQFSWYLLKIRHLIRLHRSKALQELSNTEAVSLQWVQLFMIIFVLFYALVVGMVFAQLHSLPLRHFNYIVGLLFSFSTFLIGYKGLFQKDVFIPEISHATPLPTPVPTTAPSTAITSKEKALYEKLRHYMQDQKPYLSAELSLTSLAQQLNIPRNQLSHIINVHTEENFYTFINQYRVEEVKRLFASAHHQHYTILTLAYEAGFSSKSSFNRIFKQITGSTPSEYQKKNTL